MGCAVVYYTYAHYTPKGDLFYIGKGVDDRAFSFGDRSHSWKRAVKENKGLTIEILANWHTENEAYNHEKLLIDCFTEMGHKLVNQTKGGKGAYGYVCSEEKKQHLRDKLTGFKHQTIICPKCGVSGGNTTMKRWHFDNCTGKKGTFRARVTYNNERLYLGKFATEQEATQKCIDFYASVNKPLPKEFIRHKGIQT
jgi:hypothetical protein